MRPLAFLVVVMTIIALPAAAAPVDRPPKVAVATADGAVLVGPTLATGMSVTGVASDDRRVEHVLVAFCWKSLDPRALTMRCGGLLSESRVVTADLTCRAGRRWCRWEAALPGPPGSYEVVATATDSNGRQRSSAAKAVTVVAADTEGPVRRRR